jgi:hypothetical protein
MRGDFPYRVCMSRFLFCSLLALALAACSHSAKPPVPVAAPAPAQPAAVKDRAYNAWQVMTAPDPKGGTLCYAGSLPLHQAGVLPHRGAGYVMITRRLSGRMEMSVSSGYAYAPDTKLDMVLDQSSSFRFVFRGATGWGRGEKEDKTLVEALHDTHLIQVRAATGQGIQALDDYSGDGFEDAYARIKELCP